MDDASTLMIVEIDIASRNGKLIMRKFSRTPGEHSSCREKFLHWFNEILLPRPAIFLNRNANNA
jgi:hypothetical protein